MRPYLPPVGLGLSPRRGLEATLREGGYRDFRPRRPYGDLHRVVAPGLAAACVQLLEQNPRRVVHLRGALGEPRHVRREQRLDRVGAPVRSPLGLGERAAHGVADPAPSAAQCSRPTRRGGDVVLPPDCQSRFPASGVSRTILHGGSPFLEFHGSASPIHSDSPGKPPPSTVNYRWDTSRRATMTAKLAGGPQTESDPVAEKISRTLEHEIVLGRFKPGEKLREEDLAKRFSASRHHVREGLARLERIGIVSKTKNHGVSVRRFTAEEVREIYEIREILQRQAALRIRLPVEPATIHRLASINAGYERAIRTGEFQRIREANNLFHTELFRLCGNNMLLLLIRNYMDLTYAIRGSAFGDTESLKISRQHHRIILKLLSTTDSWALAQICVDHIQATRARDYAFH